MENCLSMAVQLLCYVRLRSAEMKIGKKSLYAVFLSFQERLWTGISCANLVQKKIRGWIERETNCRWRHDVNWPMLPSLECTMNHPSASHPNEAHTGCTAHTYIFRANQLIHSPLSWVHLQLRVVLADKHCFLWIVLFTSFHLLWFFNISDLVLLQKPHMYGNVERPNNEKMSLWTQKAKSTTLFL